MPRPIFLRSNRRVTWVSLSAEGVLDFLFHDFQVRGPEAEAPLVLGFPGPRPLYDGVAGFVLHVLGQRRSFLVLPTPHRVLVDLDPQAVGRDGAAQGFGS